MSNIVIGRKLTYLRRRCKILKSSCIGIHCGFKIFCSLYIGKFRSNHSFRSGTNIGDNLVNCTGCSTLALNKKILEICIDLFSFGIAF